MTDKLRSEPPIPNAQMEELFTYVARHLHRAGGCDNTHSHTLAFLLEHNIKRGPVMKWLADTGGCCCDCEVMFHSMEFFHGLTAERSRE